MSEWEIFAEAFRRFLGVIGVVLIIAGVLAQARWFYWRWRLEQERRERARLDRELT